jgi:aspartate carbamoyltransferase catalytic subunit
LGGERGRRPYERIMQLANNPPAVKDESIIDTLRDLAVYAVIASILREEESALATEQELEECPF